MKTSPTVMVIFGATGNLTISKLIPALYQLEKAGLLAKNFKLIGVARRNLSDKDYCDELLVALRKYLGSNIDKVVWKKLSERITYLNSNFEDQGSLSSLSSILDGIEQEWKICFNRIFYLAVAPSFFPTVFNHLKHYKLNEGCAKDKNPARIVIEKPFGEDLKTARDLNLNLAKLFKEKEIYRIDHYLGKETVQNILTFRFGNEIFEPILNKNYVDHVQITMAETGGIGSRGEFYEEAGALRDVIQNHLLQILALLTMREPDRLDAESIRKEKFEALKSIRYIEPKEVDKMTVRGQYDYGDVNGEKSISYKEEERVAKNSTVETFVALKTFIDNPVWKDVPIYIRTGKRLERSVASVTIQFKETGHRLFKNFPKQPEANLLTFQLQPDEGVAIRLVAKKPGFAKELQNVDMEFCYNSSFRDTLPKAYERLLIDIMNGDQILFPHINEVKESWKFVDKILEGWKKSPLNIQRYRAGSWGPEKAENLLEHDGRHWVTQDLTICQDHSHT